MVLLCIFIFYREKCCVENAEEGYERSPECFEISTANDPIFRRACIPFLRSSPVPGFPFSSGKIWKHAES